MGKYKNKTFALRIDNTLQDKVRAIANKEDRPITAQYERIIREYISDYEAQHGEIELIPEGGAQTRRIIPKNCILKWIPGYAIMAVG